MAKKGTVLMSGQDVARVAYEKGLRGDALTTAVAIAKAESSWYRDVISETEDYGLWQINRAAHGSQYDFQRLLDDASYNAQAMMDISAKGTNWQPWCAYTPCLVGGLRGAKGTGPYRQYLSDAANVVNTFLNWGGATAGPGGGIVAASPGTAAPGNTATPAAGAVAGGTAGAAAGSQFFWREAVVEFETQYRQQDFDKRMRRVGTRDALKHIFVGPSFVGMIEPLNPKSTHGYERPAGYGGPAISVPRPANNPGLWAGTNGPVYTGTIKEGANGSADVSAPLLALKFLFNPNEISFNYSANPSILPIGAIDQTQVNPNLPMSDPNNTISFSLYFDRTYEVMDGSKLGVYLDIRQLEQLTGISPSQPVMRSYPVKLFFGKPVDFHINALISQISVAYVHFSHEMIPMRATVDITASRLSSLTPFAGEAASEFYGTEDYRTKIASGENAPAVDSMGPKK